jgi:hypothetical protein
LLEKQLESWSAAHMPEDIFCIYQLLAGEVDAVAHRALDWRTAFAMFLWYSPREGTLHNALDDYDNFARKAGSSVNDVQLNLIRLGRSVAWEDAARHLDWMTYQASPLDVSLAWHLCDLLGGHDRLTLQYAEQLEMLGYWHWATYVLSLGEKIDLAEDVIARNVAVSPTMEADEAVASRWVPHGNETVWIAKAMRAEVEKAFLIAARCYKEVEKHDEVARLLLDHVLDAVMTEGDGMPNLGTIRELLSWLDLSHVVPERIELVQLFKHHFAGDGRLASSEHVQSLALQLSKPHAHLVRDLLDQNWWKLTWDEGTFEQSVDRLIAEVIPTYDAIPIEA